MAFGNNMTVVGNLTRDPELRFTNSGTAVANFSIAWNDRRTNRQTGETEEETSFFNVTVWKDLAEHCAGSLSKGDRVILVGAIKQRDYETAEGEKRSVYEITADEVGPSLRWAEVDVRKSESSGGSQGTNRSRSQEAAPAYNNDEEPF